MQELYRYEMTDQDMFEMFGTLARCRGSKTRGQVLRSYLWRALIFIAVFVFMAARQWPPTALNGYAFLIFVVLLVVSLPFGWLVSLSGFAHAQVQQLRLQKKAAGLDTAAPELHSIRLEGKDYVRRVGERASTAVPLAALHTARPVKGGGVVLLFHTGAEDYLPPRLFSPAYTAQDFCSWISAQAAEARKTPLLWNGGAGADQGANAAGGSFSSAKEEDMAGDAALDVGTVARQDAGDAAGQETGNAAGQETGNAARQDALYLFQFSVSADDAARLLSIGSRKLSFTAAYLRQLVLGTLALAAVLLVPFLFAVGPKLGLLILGGLGVCFLLFCLICTALISSRTAYRLRLRRGALDSLLGPQRVEFYEDQVTVRRASGSAGQRYSLYLKLLDTPDAWFLVLQGSAGILPLPKEGLPEHRHAAFAAFMEEKLMR